MEDMLIHARAAITIEMESPEVVQTVYLALEPETHSVPSERAQTSLTMEHASLQIEITANDLTALRAAMNAFLAWASTCMRTLNLTKAT